MLSDEQLDILSEAIQPLFEYTEDAYIQPHSRESGGCHEESWL